MRMLATPTKQAMPVPRGWCLALVVFLGAAAACGGSDEEAEEATGAEASSGGEAEAGGTAEGMERPPGSYEPPEADGEGDEDRWDGDEEGGAEAEPGTQPAGDGDAASSAGEAAANPWGQTREEQCRQQPRRPMAAGARGAFQDGVRLAASGRYREAIRAFERALQADPNHYRILHNLGAAWHRLGEEQRALDYYRRALAAQPDYEAAAAGIVRVYVRRGSVPEAIAFLQPLAGRYPANKALQALLAEAYVLARRFDDAWRAARTALRCDERYVPALTALVKASLGQGREELAKNILEQALKIDPNFAELHVLQAKMLLKEDGRLREAVGQLEKAVQLQPDHLEARTLLGIQRLEGGAYDQALEHLRVAARLAPKLPQVHVNLAEALRANRKWQEALAEYQKALQLDPNQPGVYFDMGLLYMEAGEEFPGMDNLQAMQKAVEMFRRYRDAMGPRLPRNDPVEQYMTKLQRQIEREQRRREREARRAARRQQGQQQEGGDG